MNDRKTGIFLLVFSALMWSSAGLFTKGVEASAWNVVFWRGLFAAIGTTLFVLIRGRMRQEFLEIGKWGWFVALLGASGTAAFIPAFKITSIANVALIYASAPVFAALLAWLWIKEKPSLAVVVGVLLSIVGVGFIVGGSLGQLNLKGDFLALWMTMVIASMMVVYRRFPALASAGPTVLSSLVLLPIALYFDNPFSVPMNEILILVGFGVVFAIAPITMVEGAKRLPSGETALLSALESPLAVVLAFLIFTDIPPFMTIIGGLLILIGVLISQIFQRGDT